MQVHNKVSFPEPQVSQVTWEPGRSRLPEALFEFPSWAGVEEDDPNTEGEQDNVPGSDNITEAQRVL